MRNTRRSAVTAAAAGTALLVAGALGIAGATPTSSPMSKMRIFKGRVNGSSGTKNLTYHSGGVEVAPAIYLDFWGSWWSSPATTGTDGGFSYTNTQAKDYVTAFFGGVGGSTWAGISSQYCQGVAYGTVNCGLAGTHIQNPTGQLKSTLVDTTNPVPASPTQSQIAAEAASAATRFGIPASGQPGATVMVLTPSGASMSGFGTSWCAWHSVTSTGTGVLPYAYLPYMPDAGAACGENFVNAPSPSGAGYLDGFSVVGGHEYAEAQTDPVTSRGSYAWYDSSGQENGDKCAWSSASKDVTLGTQSFAVQPLWSNIASACRTS